MYLSDDSEKTLVVRDAIQMIVYPRLLRLSILPFFQDKAINIHLLPARNGLLCWDYHDRGIGGMILALI